jgi:hypothetical protein
MWEDGSVAFERGLGKVRTKCDASRFKAEAVQQDFLA